MYKLFLCLRYLRRRYIALVAMIGMMLCVAMVLIVVSVMDGFLNMVENAARGMMGDVVVDANSLSGSARDGMGYYGEYIDEVCKIQGVKAATPVSYAYGVLAIGPNYRQFVRMVGLDLPKAAQVTTFVKGLKPPQQADTASFNLPGEAMQELQRKARIWQAGADRAEQDLQQVEKQLDAEQAKPQPDEQKAQGLQEQADYLRRHVATLRREVHRPEQPGLILGIDIAGISKRDKVTGAYDLYISAGQTVVLMFMPTGQMSQIEQPISKSFNVAGYSRMGIYQVDSQHVYMDFNTLQSLMNMGERKDIDTGAIQPAIANQVVIKASGSDDEANLRRIADEASAAWERVVQRHPDQDSVLVKVRTWREKQAQFIGPIEKQRTLTVIMFSIISLVAVVLVFAIFYMMVIQKTKDVGILKSIGGSSGGVAGIFLMYGAAIGLMGSILGVILGATFVHYINQIHDWIARTFDWTLFDRETFLFDRIPNAVEPMVVVYVVIGAILGGLLGSVLPAMRAARMQPVEALRYE